MSSQWMPSSHFMYVQCVQELAQAVCVTPSLPHAALFYLSCQIIKCDSIADSLFYPIVFYSHVMGTNVILSRMIPPKNKKLRNRLSWVGPASIIGFVTLVACKTYTHYNDALARGVIYGIYSFIISISIYHKERSFGIFTLSEGLRSLFLNKNISMLNTSHQASCLALPLLISSVALTILFQNPILGTGIAYSIGAVAGAAFFYFRPPLEVKAVSKK